MHTVKRIEIVIDKPHERDVRRVLTRLGVPGLTVYEAVAGYGDRGERTGGELSDAQVNRCLITTCRPDQVEALAAALEPVLRRFGGLCLISDAMVIRDDPS
ncbi:MAG: transcriptional regulator [Planctomycetota bacterium]|nr:transcriptional regulator [Planctomycetota bacterium]